MSSSTARRNENGYRIRGWPDVVAVAGVLSLLLGVLAWGLKLEGELNQVRDEVQELKEQVGNGILPRAEERIESLQDELDEHKDDHD